MPDRLENTCILMPRLAHVSVDSFLSCLQLCVGKRQRLQISLNFFCKAERSRSSQLVSGLLVLNPVLGVLGGEVEEGKVTKGSLEIQTLVKQWDWWFEVWSALQSWSLERTRQDLAW